MNGQTLTSNTHILMIFINVSGISWYTCSGIQLGNDTALVLPCIVNYVVYTYSLLYNIVIYKN